MKALLIPVLFSVISTVSCTQEDESNSNLIGFKFVIIAENKCLLQFYHLDLDGSFTKLHSTNYPCFFMESWSDFNLHLQSDENFGIANAYQRLVDKHYVFYWLSITSDGNATDTPREVAVEDYCKGIDSSTLDSTHDRIIFLACSDVHQETCTIDFLAKTKTVATDHEPELKAFNAVTQQYVTYIVSNDAINVNSEKIVYLVDLKKADKVKFFASGKTYVVKSKESYYVINDANADDPIMAITTWPKLDFVVDVTEENKKRMRLIVGSGSMMPSNVSSILLCLMGFAIRCFS